MLDLRLIGPPQLRYMLQPLSQLQTPGNLALLGALLTAPHRTLPRSLLAQRFWPDQPLEGGRSNLRQLLHRLKQAWPDSDRYLDTGRHALVWRGAVPQRIDLDELESLQRAPLSPASLESILAMLSGPLLEGLEHDWITPLRQSFAQRQTQFLLAALTWTQQEGLGTLELAALQRYTDYAPTEVEPFLACLHRVARQQGLSSLRSAFARWKVRWERTVQTAPPVQVLEELDMLEELLRSGRPLPPAPLFPTRRVQEMREGDWRSSSEDSPRPAGSAAPPALALEPASQPLKPSSTGSSPPIGSESEPRVAPSGAQSSDAVQQPFRSGPPSAEQILAQAIVLGDGFSWRTLAECLGDEPAVLEALDLFMARAILTEGPNGTYSFTIPEARLERYARLTEAKKQALHSRAARILLQRPDRTPALLSALKHHLEASGDSTEVARQMVQAATAFGVQEYPQQVLTLCTRAIQLLRPEAPHDLHWAAHRMRADAGIMLKHRDTLDEDFRALQALVHEMPDLIRARRELTALRLSIANLKADINEILAASAERAALADALGLRDDACEANLQLAIILAACHRYDESERVVERARAYALELSDPEPMIHIQMLDASQLLRKLKLEEARDALQSISARMDAVRDEGLRTRYILNRAAVLISLGDHRVAAEELSAMHTRLTRRTLFYYAEMIPYFLVRARLEGGALGEAAQLLDALFPSDYEPSDTTHRKVTIRLELLLRLNQLHEAEQLIKTLPAPPLVSALGLTFAHLHADVLLGLSRWEEALRQVNVGLEACRGLQSMQGEVALKLRLARALLGMEDPSGAEWVLRELARRIPVSRPSAPWPLWRLELQGLLTQCLMAQGRAPEAWALLLECLPSLERHPDRYHREHLLWALRAELARELHRPEQQEAAARALSMLSLLQARIPPAAQERWLRAPAQVTVLQIKRWFPTLAAFQD